MVKICVSISKIFKDNDGVVVFGVFCGVEERRFAGCGAF
jgi:hypothetical protein